MSQGQVVVDADTAAGIAMVAEAAAATNALHAGARAPTFALHDTLGRRVALDQLLRAGPVVLCFLRGSWCAFDEEKLVRFSAVHERIAAAGAAALAVAPPGGSGDRVGRLPIPKLVDTDLGLARAFGLTFDLPEELRSRYTDLGYVPPRIRKSGAFLIPIPATYVLDEGGVVVFAHVDFDYRNGLDSESLLKALDALRVRREARVSEKERVNATRILLWREDISIKNPQPENYRLTG
jgi:peroxiredoxin